MEEFILTLRYWAVVIVPSAACAAARNKYVKGIFVGTILALVAFFIAPSLLANVVVPNSVSSVLVMIYRNASVSGASALIILWLIIFSISLLYRPVALDRQKSDDIKRLRDKWECVPINAGLKIECLTDESNHRVSIKIRNPLAQKLDYLTVELVSFVCVGQMYGRAPQDLNPASPHRFSEGESKESGVILPCDSTTIYIAELDQIENIVFLPKSNADFAKYAIALADNENSQDYEIELAITGHVDNKPIQAERFGALIRFRKGTQSHIRIDSVQRVVRTPASLQIEKLERIQGLL